MDDITTDIRYDRSTGDFACYATVEGAEEYIGSRGNHTDASTLCREWRFHYYADHFTPEKAAQVAMEQEPAPMYGLPDTDETALYYGNSTGGYDGGADIDPDDGGWSSDPFDDGPSQEEQAAAAALWTPCEGGWEQYTPHPFDPTRTVRLFQPYLAPTAGRELAFCSICNRPFTTTNHDEDYVCPDCAAKQSRSVVYARPAEPEPEAIEADDGPLTNHHLAAIFADNILCLPIETITIATSEGPQTSDALILGGWALNENSQGWTVTHRASGYAGKSYETPIEALIQLGIIIGAGLPSIPSDTSTFASIPDIHNISARVKAGIAVLDSWDLDLDYNERDDTSEPEPLASTASTGAPETAIAALTAAP